MKLRIQLILLVLFGLSLSAWAGKVNLTFHADGEKVLTAKVEAGGTYTIATILSDSGVTVTGCRDYVFRGWKTGGPVVGDETPTLQGATITPNANVNLYAVYEKSGVPANRYVRITSTSDLHVGSQYLIVCYYEWDGDTYYGPSYFALGNVQSEIPYWVYATGDTYTNGSNTYDMYATKYRLSATQIHPDAGAVSSPSNAIVWTLSGSVDAWKWTNAASGEKLNIGTNFAAAYYYNDGYYALPDSDYNQSVLDATGSNCSMTASNGVFNIISGDNRLSYSEDDEDYFMTREYNSWAIYLYKKESPYTSFPNCEKWTIHLDAGDGFIGTSSKHKEDSVESSAGAGIILPTASKPTDADCPWTFAGWSVETPIQGQQSPQNGKDNTPALISAGTRYRPVFNGETLYAVYEHNVGVEVYYEKITNRSELQNGDTCIIVFPTYDIAVTNTKVSTYYFDWSRVTILNDKITGTVVNEIKWKYNVFNSKGGFVYGSTYLSYDGTNSYRYYIENTSSPFHFKMNYNYGNYYLKLRGSAFGLYENGYDEFHIYKRKTRPITTYTSYPHCTLYTVHLHACGGTMIDGGKEVTDINKIEDEGTFGVVLPKPEPLCPDSGWVFLGWLEGGELDAIEDVEFTGLKNAGDRFKPSHDDIHLYAVYKRFLKKFRRIVYPYNMVPGDNYVLSYYSDGSYQWEISSDTKDANHLAAIRGEQRNDAGGAYIEVSDPKAIWKLGGTTDAWTFQDSVNGQFLKMTTDGNTSLAATGTQFRIGRFDSQFVNLTVYISSGGYYYNLQYDGTDKRYECAGPYNQTFMDQCMLYRQMREYSSWPHCDPFTVKFDGCGGNAGVTSLTEPVAYQGITLPNAYVNSDCRKEGWTFIGWSRSPITEESDALTKDLLPAETIYHPTMNNVTLYAVYGFKEDKYRRITSVEDMHTGVNYIIATSDGHALSNTTSNTNYVATKSITAVDNVIESEDEALEWRIQGVYGSYELYNLANELYLDLRTEGYALLTEDMEDNFFISYSGGKFVVCSNRNRSDWKGLKYLGYDGVNSYFNTVDKDHLPMLYFYQQQATYHSYPECVSGIEALRWTVEDDGNYVYVESYMLKGLPEMDGGIGDAFEYVNAGAKDGSIKIQYSTDELHPRDETPITWGSTDATFTIPYIISSSQGLAALGLPDHCTNCDVVVMPGQTLTVDVNHKSVHNLMLHEDAKLVVNNNDTLKVNSLIMRVEDDQKMPSIDLKTSGAISLTNKELIFDARIDEERWYWYSLPFDTHLQGISYSNLAANGGAPTYLTDFFLKFYNGKLRADDANGGALADTYWQHVAAAGNDYELQAGRGHILGIADQKHIVQPDDRKHTKRVMRFFMSMNDKLSWNEQERANKNAPVEPSQCNSELNKVHAGWNLIGNPFLHNYAPGETTGIKTGEWEKIKENGAWTGWWQVKSGTESVPYLTLYDPAQPAGEHYSQVLASTATIKPFVAVFVQVNSGTQINFTSAMNVSAAPAYKRFVEPEAPLYTGILLRNVDNAKIIDRTGIVLNEEFTTEYEIGGDLQKMCNSARLNLYTLNKYNQELAFNGLSDEDAIIPIPVGVKFPVSGEYTFAFDAEQYSLNALDTLQLVDYKEGKTADLLHGEYTFTAAGGTVNDRFAIIVRRAHKSEEIATDLDNIYDADKPRKIIRDGILFILRDDKMYNAVGIEVR